LNLFIWAIIFFIINNVFFLIYEEPNLEKRFGEQYRKYKKEVPRWIPKIRIRKN
jgi:protein-S-isoprenylcysteine O-methyltransferase Ste14